MTGLMYYRPDDHIKYLQDCLTKVKAEGWTTSAGTSSSTRTAARPRSSHRIRRDERAHPTAATARAWYPPRYVHLIYNIRSLPPANEVYEGYVFTGLSTGGYPPRGRHNPWADTSQADTPGQRNPWQRTPPGAENPPVQTTPCAVHAGIRSTSGRYASHWNAFMLHISFEKEEKDLKS